MQCVTNEDYAALNHIPMEGKHVRLYKGLGK